MPQNVRGIVPCSCVWPAGGFCSLRKERLYSRGKTDIIEESNLDGCENMPKERLDKVLASQNIGSRKESGALIRRGVVTVNGQVVLITL